MPSGVSRLTSRAAAPPTANRTRPTRAARRADSCPSTAIATIGAHTHSGGCAGPPGRSSSRSATGRPRRDADVSGRPPPPSSNVADVATCQVHGRSTIGATASVATEASSERRLRATRRAKRRPRRQRSATARAQPRSPPPAAAPLRRRGAGRVVVRRPPLPAQPVGRGPRPPRCRCARPRPRRATPAQRKPRRPRLGNAACG